MIVTRSGEEFVETKKLPPKVGAIDSSWCLPERVPRKLKKMFELVS